MMAAVRSLALYMYLVCVTVLLQDESRLCFDSPEAELEWPSLRQRRLEQS